MNTDINKPAGKLKVFDYVLFVFFVFAFVILGRSFYLYGYAVAQGPYPIWNLTGLGIFFIFPLMLSCIFLAIISSISIFRRATRIFGIVGIVLAIVFWFGKQPIVQIIFLNHPVSLQERLYTQRTLSEEQEKKNDYDTLSVIFADPQEVVESNQDMLLLKSGTVIHIPEFLRDGREVTETEKAGMIKAFSRLAGSTIVVKLQPFKEFIIWYAGQRTSLADEYQKKGYYFDKRFGIIFVSEVWRDGKLVVSDQ